MCGIFGQINWSGSAQESLVRRMAQRVAHRGPDGYGLHTEPVCAIGAGRLAIIDLAAPPGVVYNEDGRVCIVFNGEIYNYRVLHDELERVGHHFATRTDTEVIVHGYEEWGERVLDRLHGMFAFAIWDARASTLFLARDRIGEKPLYYTLRENGEFLFASEIKALFEHPDIRPTVNMDALPTYLTLGYVPPPMTMFAGIQKLAPGQYARLTPHGLTIERYWTPQMNTATSLSYEEAVKDVRKAVIDAVETRMISDVPVGAFLSGGVDSTAVVAIMQRAMNQRLHTFTVGFDFEAGSSGDSKFNVDAQYAEQAAAHIGTIHHRIVIRDAFVCDLLPHLIYQMDEPIAQHSIIQTLYVSALARHTDIPVLLSGDAGDELFLGYSHYQNDQLLGRFLALPGLLREQALIPFMERVDRWRELARKAKQSDPSARYLEWMRVFTQEEAAALLVDPKQAARASETVRQTLKPFLAAPQTGNFEDRIAYTSLRLWIPEDSNMRVDKMSMLMSIEARAPLEDHRLVDLALHLPSRYKLRGGTFKAVFKDAVKDFVPQNILDRPKWGFIPPTSDWLRTVFLPLVEIYLSKEYVTAAGMVNADVVSRLVTEHLSRTGYHLKPLWSLLTLHLWHALYIDGSLTLPQRLTPAAVVEQARIVEAS